MAYTNESIIIPCKTCGNEAGKATSKWFDTNGSGLAVCNANGETHYTLFKLETKRAIPCPPCVEHERLMGMGNLVVLAESYNGKRYQCLRDHRGHGTKDNPVTGYDYLPQGEYVFEIDDDTNKATEMGNG